MDSTSEMICNGGRIDSNWIFSEVFRSWADLRRLEMAPMAVHPIGVTVSPNGREVWASSYRTSLIYVFENLNK